VTPADRPLREGASGVRTEEAESAAKELLAGEGPHPSASHWRTSPDLDVVNWLARDQGPPHNSKSLTIGADRLWVTVEGLT
jgi:hypothetical protein